jgi:excisionase family DNA binding protein
VFTVEEAAQLLGISRSFAYEAVQRGEIPSMRIGKRILVPKAALERLLSSPASSNPSEGATGDSDGGTD